MHDYKRMLCTLLAATSVACGDSAAAGSGDVRLSLESEPSITEGLEAGDAPEDLRDGYRARFDRFLFAVGRVRAHSTAQGSTLEDAAVRVLDLTQLTRPASLLSEDDVAAIRYDEVSFDNPAVGASAKAGAGVADEDVERMRDNAWSIQISGEIERDDGAEPSRVRFDWGLPAATRYEHCGPEDGDLGFAVASGGTTSAAFAIHGDHFFFDGFPEGAEVVTRRASWIAASDVDGDGEVTVDELKETAVGDAFPADEYRFAGAPVPIRTAYDFALAQARTLGHFQGEGECAWSELD